MIIKHLRTKATALVALAASLLFPIPSAHAFTSADADAAFDAYNKAFYVTNGNSGYYKANLKGGRADFWKQAEEIEVVIDAYERSGSPAHKQLISQTINGFINYLGADWRTNKYNDDIMWMVIACSRASIATGSENYKQLAKTHFDLTYARAWDTNLGGGLYWTTNCHEKNACINGPATIAACLLYELTRDGAYLNKATAIYAWERNTLFEPSTGKVYDNMKTNGALNHWLFTYNQGTFIGAANYLRKLTGDPAYTADALKAADYTRSSMCTEGILPEYKPGNDSSGFTSVFTRWMLRFVSENNLWDRYYDWLSKNADAAWSVRRSDNLSWCKWRTPTPADMNLGSWDCASSVAILQVVPAQKPAGL